MPYGYISLIAPPRREVTYALESESASALLPGAYLSGGKFCYATRHNRRVLQASTAR